MTNAQAQHPSSDDGKDESTTSAESASASPKATPAEPMTPARVFEWNSYYDLYVAAGVLLLAFLSSANRLQPENSVLWSYLHAGRQISEAGRPIVSDLTSIAGQDRRWVNIPWLFEWTHYQIYAAVARLLPPDPSPDLVSKIGRGATGGIGVLIALAALARGLTAFLLLKLRRPGPGLWWVSACVALALGVFLVPIEIITSIPDDEGTSRVIRTIGVQLGGLARPAMVSPGAWGLLLFAAEILLLDRALRSVRPGNFYLLIPLFLLWANLDDTFSYGLVVLAGTVLGSAFEARKSGGAGPSRLRPSLIALAACVLATLVSPSHVFGLAASFDSVLSKFGMDFGPQPPSLLNSALATWPNRLFFGGLLLIGLLSFAINRRNFQLGRLLGFLAATLMLAMSLAFLPFFAIALAAALATNGQEWYLDTFGAEGKVGTGWRVWSTGGRLVTISLLFLAITQGLTGWGGQADDSVYGFGFNPDDFPFEMTHALESAQIEGGILNTTLAQGDLLAWRVAPKRKAFIDNRPHLYKLSDFREWEDLRLAIRDDDVNRWRPALDKYKVSTILIQAANAPRTYTRLMTSPNWIPFYDDGLVQMFGRSDDKVPAGDLAYFKANRLDPDKMAYQTPREVPPLQRTPTATSEIDAVFRNRVSVRTQPHVEAAFHWMFPAGLDPAKPFLPDPARCLLAIREARIALVAKPDDPLAFQRLIDAYRLLLIQESALINGIALTSDNIAKMSQGPQQTRILAIRSRQLLTAMNYAIQTLPPPKDANERRLLSGLNMSMAQLYLQMGILDLARDRLLAIDLSHKEEFAEADFITLTQQLNELNQRIRQIEAQIRDMVIQRRASPQEKAGFARSQGAYGLAIRELEEADQSGGGNPASIRPGLLDLYCETGQPDKAFDLLGNSNSDDPTFSTGVGTSPFRQGRVHFLLGNYTNAVLLWASKAIPPLQVQRSFQALTTAQMILTGEPMSATRTLMDIPEMISQQAEWEFETALAALEGGIAPSVAAEHFTKALELEPDLAIRPVIAYYLEKLGKPVPPARTVAPEEKSAPPAPAPPTQPEPEAKEKPPEPATPTEPKEKATEPAPPTEPPPL
ncbi:tetratricopeptide repeat protein [Tundrisphaera sp. TA3]|uniref:tetratricopeptide repeat protein n=1 Tax=Tundrisphaera sp. TA3 TaxID=3435775 RepID=UPI003EBD597D